MSYITGKAASADVRANGAVTVMSWSGQQLDAIYRKHPEFQGIVQAAMGRNMAEKLRRTHEPMSASGDSIVSLGSGDSKVLPSST